MQGPDSTDPEQKQPEVSEETLKLQAEYARLKEKREQTDDPDIVSVLDMRLQELTSLLAESEAETEAEEELVEEPEEIRKSRQELQRLKDKLAKTKDRNIISVLQMRIGQIEPTLPPDPKLKIEAKKKREKQKELEKQEEEFAKIPLPTPAESEEAEKLIRQSMLEKRRGNANGATELLKKAAEVAPGSSVVLEALGDDLFERKLIKPAREAYAKAMKLDPKNVGVERKYALMVLGSTSTMSVENQLRFGVSDSIFLTGEDQVAGLLAAKFLSALIPGGGQLVIGRTTKGAILLGAWVLLVGLLALWNKDFELLAKYTRGAGPAPNWRVLVPIIGMASVWITSMADLFSGQSKSVTRSTKVERPKPPVDLPFE